MDMNKLKTISRSINEAKDEQFTTAEVGGLYTKGGKAFVCTGFVDGRVILLNGEDKEVIVDADSFGENYELVNESEIN